MSETPNSPITVYVIDDHPVVREGLGAILGREADIRIVGSAGSGEQALEELPGVDPDVVILDYRLPGASGAQISREIARRHRARIVVLSAFLHEDVVEAAFQAGAHAYIVKDADVEELKRAVRAVAGGGHVLDPKIAGRFVGWAARIEPHLPDALSAQQKKILALLVEGHPARSIAATVGLSEHTVRSYTRDIYAKLGVHNRAQVASVALRRGLV